MTHEELRKECLMAYRKHTEIVGNRSEKIVDAMMEVAAKAWEQGYETSENRHEHFNKITNPYLKPE